MPNVVWHGTTLRLLDEEGFVVVVFSVLSEGGVSLLVAAGGGVVL
jgi:hypothetical protein